MAFDGDRLWEFVREVHDNAGEDGPAAEVLWAEHLVGPPDLHVVTHQRYKELTDVKGLGAQLPGLGRAALCAGTRLL